MIGRTTNSDVVGRLVNIIGTKGSASKTLLNKPFAFVFSKLDAVLQALEATGQTDVGRYFDLNKNSSFIKTGRFSLSDVEDKHLALMKFAEDWHMDGICRKIEDNISGDTGNLRLFGVSSLGCQPVNRRIEFIKPYRVMDPLIWILHKMGGFDIPVED